MGLLNRTLMRASRAAFINLLVVLVATTSTSVIAAATPADTWRAFAAQLQQSKADPQPPMNARLAKTSGAMSTALSSQMPQYSKSAWLALNGFPAIYSDGITGAVEYADRLYVSGMGLSVGNLSGETLIAWDGDHWSAIPTPGVDNQQTNAMPVVYSMAVFGNELIAGIVQLNFNSGALTLTNSGIYAWNGSEWRTLDENIDSITAKIQVIDGGVVALMVEFGNNGQPTGVIKTRLWNGAVWGDMPSADLLNGMAITSFQGQLYWGGKHQKAGDSSNRYGLAAWDGTSWKVVESSIMGGGEVSRLTEYQDELVVGGDFFSIDGVAAKNIARWDGASWDVLSAGLIPTGYEVESVISLRTIEGRLFMMADYSDSLNNIKREITAWNGSQLEVLANDFGGYFDGFTDLSFVPFQEKLLLFNVTHIDGDYFNSVAILGDTGWTALGAPVLQTANAVTTFNDRLVVAGNFSDGSNAIAWQEPSGWQKFAVSNGKILSLVAYQGKLIAAGEFTNIDGVAADNIAVWNGTNWAAFGGGLGSTITKLFVFKDQIYVIGNGSVFTDAQSAILYWDGVSWVAPGAGSSILPVGQINTAVEFNGQLVIGGRLRLPTGYFPLVAWDGVSMTPFAQSQTNLWLSNSGWVGSLAVYDGELIAAANVNAGGNNPQLTPSLAAWNGSSWRTFTDISNYVEQVAVFDDQLMVLEKTDLNSGIIQRTHALKVWDGQSWSGLTFDGYQLGLQWPNGMFALDDLLVFTGDFYDLGSIDLSNNEYAVVSPGIIGLQSLHASITFAGEGSAGLSPIAATVGSTITLQNLTRDHYSFLGWNTAADGSGTRYNDTLLVPHGATTLYAEWAEVLYSVTFVSYENTFEIASYPFGAAIVEPLPTSREGYTFVDWDVAVPTTMPANDLTFTAQWEINNYTINFVTAGGDAIAPAVLNYGAAVTLPTPVREGYEFKGWDIAVPTTMPANDLTFTAQWEISSYTINFVTAGGDTIAPVVLSYGAAVTLPTPVREGYEFKGWDIFVPEIMPAANLTFTAFWQVIVQSSSSSDSSSSASSTQQSSQASSASSQASSSNISSSSQTSASSTASSSLSSLQGSSQASSSEVSSSSQASFSSADNSSVSSGQGSSQASSSDASSSSQSSVSSTASSRVSSDQSSNQPSSSSTDNTATSSSSQAAVSSSSASVEPGSGNTSSASSDGAQSSIASSTASSATSVSDSSSSQTAESSSSASSEPSSSSSAGMSQSSAASSVKRSGGGGGSSSLLLLILLCAGLLFRRPQA